MLWPKYTKSGVLADSNPVQEPFTSMCVKIGHSCFEVLSFDIENQSVQ